MSFEYVKNKCISEQTYTKNILNKTFFSDKELNMNFNIYTLQDHTRIKFYISNKCLNSYNAVICNNLLWIIGLL